MEQRFCPKRCTSRSLAETVANTEELLTEILVRVPARPLVRLKCVSKHWLSLISDPRFCRLHTFQNPNPPISAVFPDTSLQPFSFIQPFSSNISNRENQNPSPSGSPPFNPLKFTRNQYRGDFRIIQSCNGLFLCCRFYCHHVVNLRLSTIHSKIVDPPYFVLNPTTNQFSTIPPPPPPPPATVTATGDEQVEEPYIISIALAFDPYKSPYYKVICLRTVDGTKNCKFFHILIYSSETQSWRLIDSTFRQVYSIPYGRVLYWNGAINWLGRYGEVEYFHVDEERDGFVGKLRCLYEKKMCARVYRYFRESGDGRYLHLIDIFQTCLTKFEVLEMGRDYSGWFVMYNVDLEPLLPAFPRFAFGRFAVLFLYQDKNEEEECSSLLLHTFGKLISYNLKSKTFRTFELPPMAEVDDSLLRVQASNFRYVETLACV